MSHKGPDAMAAVWSPSLSASLQAQLVKNDTRVLVAFWRKQGERPSHEYILNDNHTLTMTIPCLLYAGEADPNMPMSRRVSRTCLTLLARWYRIWVKV